MNSWDDLARTLAGYCVAAVIAVVVGGAAWRTSGRRLLTLQRLRIGHWTGVAFVVHLVLWHFCLMAAIALVAAIGLYERLLPANPNHLRQLFFAAPLGVATFFALSVNWLARFSGSSPASVGIGVSRWREHVAIGAMAFLTATPVISVIFAAILQFVDNEPTSVERMFDEGRETFEWFLLFAQTAVFAPLYEEWLFRGLLQGWLRRTNLLGHAMLLWGTISFGAYGTFVGHGRAEVNPLPFYFLVLLAIGYAVGVVALYRPVLRDGLRVFARPDDAPPPGGAPDLWTSNLFEAEGKENRVTPWSDFGPAWWRWKIANGWLAIYGSAMVFASLHPWPTPIPLFAFGLIAGWLAFRTQSLIPGIVMHTLFNVVAFVWLWLKLHPGIIGNELSVTVPPPGTAIVAPAEPAPR